MSYHPKINYLDNVTSDIQAQLNNVSIGGTLKTTLSTLTNGVSAVNIEPVYVGNKTILNLSTLDGGAFTVSSSASFYDPLLPGYVLIPNRNSSLISNSQYVIDLQAYRESSSQMCAGYYNNILGGAKNTIGSQPQYSSIIGGESNMISGSGVVYSTVFGRNNVCVHQYTLMTGIYGKSFAGKSQVMAGNTGGAYGGTQSERYGSATAETVGTNVASFSLDGITSQIDISPNSIIHGVAKVCGMTYSPSSNTNSAGYDIEFTAKRGPTGSVSFVGTPVVRAQENDTQWDCGLKLQSSSVQITAATYTAGINAKWGAIIDIVRTDIGY